MQTCKRFERTRNTKLHLAVLLARACRYGKGDSAWGGPPANGAAGAKGDAAWGAPAAPAAPTPAPEPEIDANGVPVTEDRSRTPPGAA